MLKVSTRGRYGLLAMIELACGYGGRPVQLTFIAEKHSISRKYLHNLMTMLRGAGLVRSERGAQGGFLLNRAPAEVTLKDVLYTLEGETGAAFTGNHGPDATIVDEVIGEIGLSLQKVLESVTLEQLAARSRQKSGQLMYYI